MNSKLEQATKLEAEAARLRKQAFEERCLPDFWRIGQRVRYITDSEYAWRRGDIAQIVGFHSKYPEGTTPAREEQVFYTAPPSSSVRYWTTPSDVELICETSDDVVRGLVEAAKAFAEFDQLPTQAKRPDIFELKVRQPMLAAVAAYEKDRKGG